MTNKIDKNKIDEAALALLFLSMHSDDGLTRAWKGIDWEVMNSLYEKGYRAPLKIAFLPDSGVSSVLNSSCSPCTLRVSVRCFLAIE